MAMTSSMHHLGVLANGMDVKNTVLVSDVVDVHGSVTALSRDVLIERIPSHALNEMIMFCNFMHTFPLVRK